MRLIAKRSVRTFISFVRMNAQMFISSITILYYSYVSFTKRNPRIALIKVVPHLTTVITNSLKPVALSAFIKPFNLTIR